MDALSTTYTPTAWGLRLKDLTLPSGQVCQIKDSIDLTDLIELGVYEELDSLGMIVDEEHVQRVKGQPQDHKKKKKDIQEDTWQGIVKDKSKFSVLAGSLDKVLLYVVVQPKIEDAYEEVEEIELVPGPGEKAKRTIKRIKIELGDRDPGKIYSDSISFVDKMAIFEEVTSGVSKMADFRKGSEKIVGDVVNLPEYVDTSE